jgi:hypothetical protein
LNEKQRFNISKGNIFLSISTHCYDIDNIDKIAFGDFSYLQSLLWERMAIKLSSVPRKNK